MKKILVIALAMSLLCILAVGSTMSYLTYTDFDVNTMAVGNVKIEQFEQKRDGSNLVDFVDNVKLLPVVSKGVAGELEITSVEINGTAYGLYDTNQNVLDKIVTVRNTGSEDAYVRTVFAFELKKTVADDDSITWENPVGEDVILNSNGIEVTESVIYKYENGTFGTGSANAVTAYAVGYYNYDVALAASETSTPSLLQVYLHSSVGNDFFEAIDGNYEIRVLSQAVQTTGFVNAQEALGAAFGEVTAANAAEWFQEVN